MLLKLLDVIGFAVCHQLAERSLHFGALKLPVCARDTGIYFGFLGSFIYLNLINRKRQNRLPPWYILVFGGIGIALLAIDGFSSYGGLRTTTNEIRVITGLLTGAALPLVLVPIFNFQVWKKSTDERIIRNVYHFLGYLAVIAGLFIVSVSGLSFLFWPLALLAGFSVIFAFVYINLILVTIVPFWSQKSERLRDLAIPFVIAVAMAGVELVLSYQLHAYLLARIGLR